MNNFGHVHFVEILLAVLAIHDLLVQKSLFLQEVSI